MSQSDTDHGSPDETEPPIPADAPTRPLTDDLDVALTGAVAAAFETSLDTDSTPRSLADWVDVLADRFPAWPPAVEDLCHDAEGAHHAVTGPQSFRFTCVLDAMLLPFLHGEATTVTSRVPGTADVVTVHVTQTAVTGSPDAVVSFGAADRPPAGAVTAEHAYGVICPFVHTFPDEDAYAAWAATVDAPTMALSLPDALGLAKAMAEV